MTHCLEFSPKNLPMSEKIKILLKLLDDPSQQVAHSVMLELLKNEDIIEPYLAEHQETENELLRKRIHQLQSIITIRQRRTEFTEMLRSDPSLIEGLIAVHLQWYDNDLKRELDEAWTEMCGYAERSKPRDLRGLAHFMRKNDFTAPLDADVHAEHYCLGPVLEERVGADFILAAIASEIGNLFGQQLHVAKSLDDFIVVDHRGNGLTVRKNWQLLPNINITQCDFWNNQKILKMAALMLFQYAVSSDSFRYVSTIGHAMIGLDNDEPLDFLPYPYN
mgnify:FL=1